MRDHRFLEWIERNGMSIIEEEDFMPNGTDRRHAQIYEQLTWMESMRIIASFSKLRTHSQAFNYRITVRSNSPVHFSLRETEIWISGVLTMYTHMAQK